MVNTIVQNPTKSGKETILAIPEIYFPHFDFEWQSVTETTSTVRKYSKNLLQSSMNCSKYTLGTS